MNHSSRNRPLALNNVLLAVLVIATGSHSSGRTEAHSAAIQPTIGSSERPPTVRASAASGGTRVHSLTMCKRWNVRLRDSKQRTLVVVVEATTSSHARKVANAQFPALRFGSVREIKPT